MSENSKNHSPALPPTPAEMPTTTHNHHLNDLSHTPQTTASFQAVLKHNQDLMARLSISLRRISHMEKHLEDFKSKFNAEKSAADGLRDEVMIHTEKSRLNESELQRLQNVNLTQSHKIELLQTQLSSLKAEHDELKIQHKNELLDLKASHKNELGRFLSENDKKLTQLEITIADLEKVKKEAERVLKPKYKQLKSLCEKQMDKISALNQLNQSLASECSMAKKMVREERHEFEHSKEELRSELRQAKNKLLHLLKIENKYRSAHKEKTFWENKFITLESKYESLVNTAAQRDGDQDLLMQAKNEEIKRLKIENFELKKSWSASHQNEKSLKDRLQGKETEAESLKHMWQQKNSKIDELAEQVKIYETMRLELSTQIQKMESEISNKNKKIESLLKVVESMKSQGSYQSEAIIETAVRGMKDLFFEEEKPPIPPVVKNKDISF